MLKSYSINKNLSPKDELLNKIFPLFSIFLLIIIYFLPYLTIGSFISNSKNYLFGTNLHDFILMGKFYSGDSNALKYPMGGSLNWSDFFSSLKPSVLLFVLFGDQSWVFIVFFNYIVYFFSTYLFLKKINKNYFQNCLISIFYAYLLNINFGVFEYAFLPYFFYLINFKNKFTYKHYLILIFFGLNSSFIFFSVIYFLSIILSYFFNKDIKFHIILKAYGTFFICSFLTDLNYLISFLRQPTMRSEFTGIAEYQLSAIINSFFYDFLNIPSINTKDKWFFLDLSKKFILFFIIFISLFYFKKNNFKIIILFYLFVISYQYFSRFIPLLNNDFFNILNLEYKIKTFENFLYIFFILFIFNQRIKIINYSFYFLLIIYVFTIPTRLSLPVIITHLTKTNLEIQSFEKLKNYFNSKEYIELIKFASKIKFNKKTVDLNKTTNLTYETYYHPSDMKKIKGILKNETVLAVNLDPSIAFINGINTLGGNFANYSLDFKKKFREIIENSGEINLNYFDTVGHRAWAFFQFDWESYGKEVNWQNIYSYPISLNLNFSAAKRLGAKYVLTNLTLKNKDLQLVCNNCNESLIDIKKFNIYRIDD